MKNIFFLFGIIILLFSTKEAQQWRFLGLEEEFVSAIAVDWSNPDIIYAGSFSNFSSGKRGGIFKTIDGGISWDTLVRGVTVRDIDIHPKNPNIIYATGSVNALTYAGVVKSYDGGKSWIKADSNLIKDPEAGASLLVIDPEHPDTIYAGTSGFGSGTVNKSTNGGLSWLQLKITGGITALEIDPENSLRLFYGTDGSANLYETLDGGLTWEFAGLSEKGIIYSIKIDPDSSDIIYTGTSGSGLFKSIDGGTTWEQYNKGLKEDETVFKIQFIYGEQGRRMFINASASSGIYLLNNKQEWEPYGNVGSWTMIIANNRLYAVGALGVYVTDLITSINSTNNDIQLPRGEQVKLIQNYPNPFNPSTVISYQLPAKSYVTLKIYDALGREIISLAEGSKTAGYYEATFDGSNLSSGIYIYRLTANSLESGEQFVKSAKMMLVK